MSHNEDLFARHDDPTSGPDFEVAFRGYDKQQVDNYVVQIDGQLSALGTERERLHGQLHELGAQLARTHAELTDLRQQPPQLERASFRDLGPTVDQILALAEQQAKTITDTAAARATEQENEAEQTLAAARQHADTLRSDSEAAYERAEQEAARINDASAQQLADARAEADALLDAARAQTQQEVQDRQQALAMVQGELDRAQQQLMQSRQEATGVERDVAQLQQRLDEVGRDLTGELERLEEARQAADAAERHAKEVRARVKREAERVAQLAATAVIAAATRGAETGEYPMVVAGQSRGSAVTNEVADNATELPVGTLTADPATMGERPVSPGYEALTTQHTRELDHAVPAPRAPHSWEAAVPGEPQPGAVTADAE